MNFNFLAFILTMTLVAGCKNTESSNKPPESESKVNISLAQWSFHKALQSGKMDHLEFITKAASLGFEGVEYVNVFFKDKAQDISFLDRMNKLADSSGIQQLLIMVDGEGYLADIDSLKRNEAVQNHFKWVDAAKYLGCHSIRVNAHGEGTIEETMQAAIDGLKKLSEYAATKDINVLVENHGGYSSNGKWLSEVMTKVNMKNCGTLPDFGNFCLKNDPGVEGNPCIEEYDRYKGVEELMPFAKAVSAKSHEFGENGFETTIDYTKMLSIVKSAGYVGFIGVEYEGKTLDEESGIIATRDLISKISNQE
ncbi:MAG: sugar phosphate isomerase/epimerase [Saprospiraceae bacterium]|nr:sugar phosphate isomerase/epimerase [Saprospiraceae bacterium]